MLDFFNFHLIYIKANTEIMVEIFEYYLHNICTYLYITYDCLEKWVCWCSIKLNKKHTICLLNNTIKKRSSHQTTHKIKTYLWGYSRSISYDHRAATPHSWESKSEVAAHTKSSFVFKESGMLFVLKPRAKSDSNLRETSEKHFDKISRRNVPLNTR